MELSFWPIRQPIIIGEVAQAHDGSLGYAHAFIDLVADAGADAVKFQTHIAEAESSSEEPWRVKFSYEDDTRYEYWKRMEFTFEQWLGLKRHADERKIAFLSSPFSLEAVRLLSGVGQPAWKVASGEVTNGVLIDALIRTGKPIWLSSGMSTFGELDEAVSRVLRGKNDLMVFQCTSSYPTPPEAVGLNLLDQLADRYGCPVGLSDHSGDVFAGLAAVAKGAAAVEVHVTMSRSSFGPDVSSSLTPAQLSQLVKGANQIDIMNKNAIDKDEMSTRLEGTRRLFQKSLTARRSLGAGEIVMEKDVYMSKPGTGIPYSEARRLIGRTLRRAVRSQQQFQASDFYGDPN
jgi:N,N'-diacetyllegionaminate synthase